MSKHLRKSSNSPVNSKQTSKKLGGKAKPPGQEFGKPTAAAFRNKTVFTHSVSGEKYVVTKGLDNGVTVYKWKKMKN